MKNHKPSSHVRRRLRIAAYERQGGRCFYCSTAMLLEGEAVPTNPDFCTLDRIEPGAAGGRYCSGNVVAACKGCNSARKTLSAFLFMRIAHRLGREDVRRSFPVFWRRMGRMERAIRKAVLAHVRTGRFTERMAA